ncbi:MAG: InlB B-repeat-containing protein [Chitinispirillales bacterium]|nr:InlB B-repeat-containing protein [Chitinispirillales bacterium]
MKKLTFALIIAFFASAPAVYAQVKYVAVVETEVDAASGASDDITSAEVRLMTAELRREAVKNLPRGKYNIMTSETVYAQGSAVLESCADENCVISLGAKIGADYIVRGIISKLRTRFTLSVEIYETENGNLMASSDPVRSENIAELIEKAAAVCAEMYKTFAASQSAAAPRSTLSPAQIPAQSPAPKAPETTYAVTVAADPASGGYVTRNPNQARYAPGTRVNLMASANSGYKFSGWSGDTANAIDAANLLTVTMNGDKSLTANFIRPTYNLTVNTLPPYGGYVTRKPDKETYNLGEKVLIIAAPAKGYRFTGWTSAAVTRTDRPTVVSVTIDGDKKLSATFSAQNMPPAAAPAPKPEPKADAETGTPETAAKKYSVGGGMLYSGNFGGGIQWEDGREVLAMPYHALGAYLFVDAGYFAGSIGYQTGGGKWETPNNIDPNQIDLPYTQRSALNIGVFAKYPGLVKTNLPAGNFIYNVDIYPIIGLDYEYATSGKLEFGLTHTYIFDGSNEDGYTADALSALWVKFGGGLDIYLKNVFFRFELMYGVRGSSWYETKEAKKDADGSARLGHGLTLRVGAGFKL